MSITTRNRNQVLIIIAFVALAAVVAFQTYSLVVLGQSRIQGASNNVGTSIGTQNTITVPGTGHVEVTPDTSIIMIGVLTQESTAQAAIQNNANSMNQVIQALNNMGIDNTNIQTTYYYVSAQMSNSQPPMITGYQVTNQVHVTVVVSGQTVNQLGTKVGQVIDTAVSQGANQLNGVQFTASKGVLQQAEVTALQKAAQDASTQAHTIASAMGVTISGVVSVTLGSSNSPSVYIADYSSASTPVIPPQSLTVTTTVQAVFSIS